MIRLLVAYHLSWIRLKRETNYLNLVAESRTIRDNTRYRAVCLEDETVPSGGVKRTQYECCYTVLQPSDIDTKREQRPHFCRPKGKVLQKRVI